MARIPTPLTHIQLSPSLFNIRLYTSHIRRGVTLEERLALLEQEGAVHAARAWATHEAAAKLCTMLRQNA